MEMPNKTIVIGTAGHIDHGKSTLVRAITGTDPDRLPEEKARGMTIDLGFAFWEEHFAFVDVPGHEKFIKNMVAGAYGIDAVLFVIAADDGIMPQTREHYDIIHLLGIQKGVVAITKSDLVDSSWLDLVKEEVASFLKTGSLKDAPIIEVDSITHRGIDQLKDELKKLLQLKDTNNDHLPFQLPIDRVFVKQGFGVVVTGTIVQGTIKVGDTLELLPTGKRVRVRGIQSKLKNLEVAYSSMRAALNITGIESTEVERGYRLCQVDVWKPTKIFDVRLSTLNNYPLKNRTRVRLHIGTAELIGRLTFLDEQKESNFIIARFHSETNTVVNYRERFIIRSYSPIQTVGGGVVLVPIGADNPKNQKALLSELAKTNDANEIGIYLNHSQNKAISLNELQVLLSKDYKFLQRSILNFHNTIVQEGDFLLLKESISFWKSQIINELTNYHQQHPERLGMSVALLYNQFLQKIGKSFLEKFLKELECEKQIIVSNSLVRKFNHKTQLSLSDEKMTQKLIEWLEAKSFNPQSISVIAKELDVNEKELQRIIDLLREYGVVIILEGKIPFLKELFEKASTIIQNFIKENGSITIGKTTELLNTSRKIAVALLEFLDKLNITRRIDDLRVLVNETTIRNFK
ncbi:MAG: selenocysteine-specific translation elongation factor [bacterium]|nr:selenocysteine-specific translation elongation factor [bacterium]